MTTETFDHKSLGHSPFLDAYGGEDRKFWNAILGLLAGAVGAAVAAVVAGVIFALGYVAFISLTGGSYDEVKELFANVKTEGFVLDLHQTILILIFVAVVNVTFFGGVAVIAGLIRRRPVRAYFTAAPKFRWGLVLAGLVMFTAVIGPILALDAITSPTKPQVPLLTLATTPVQRIEFVIAAVGSLLFAAMVEELLCRGWLLRVSGAFTRNVWILAVVNGLLFSAMHLPDVDPTAFVARALMGMGFVYMTLRTGGIEFSSGAHAANNILLVLFVQPLPLAIGKPQPFSLTSTAFGVIAVIGYVVITEILMRWPALRRLTKAEVAPPEVEAFS